jgi:hypothetical protein
MLQVWERKTLPASFYVSTIKKCVYEFKITEKWWCCGTANKRRA